MESNQSGNRVGTPAHVLDQTAQAETDSGKATRRHISRLAGACSTLESLSVIPRWDKSQALGNMLQSGAPRHDVCGAPSQTVLTKSDLNAQCAWRINSHPHLFTPESIQIHDRIVSDPDPHGPHVVTLPLTHYNSWLSSRHTSWHKSCSTHSLKIPYFSQA